MHVFYQHFQGIQRNLMVFGAISQCFQPLQPAREMGTTPFDCGNADFLNQYRAVGCFLIASVKFQQSRFWMGFLTLINELRLTCSFDDVPHLEYQACISKMFGHYIR